MSPISRETYVDVEPHRNLVASRQTVVGKDLNNLCGYSGVAANARFGAIVRAAVRNLLRRKVVPLEPSFIN